MFVDQFPNLTVYVAISSAGLLLGRVFKAQDFCHRIIQGNIMLYVFCSWTCIKEHTIIDISVDLQVVANVSDKINHCLQG